jgi:predicted transcriptional regulator
LNPFIAEVIPSIREYFKELINVNVGLIEKIKNGTVKAPEKIRSRSICISIHEILIICEGIKKQENEIREIANECLGYVEKIMFYQTEYKIFTEKPHPNPNIKWKLKPLNAYINIYELIYPKDIISNYMEEYNKMHGMSKKLSESEQVILDFDFKFRSWSDRSIF